MIDGVNNGINEGPAAKHERAAVILHLVKASFEGGFVIAVIDQQRDKTPRIGVNGIGHAKDFCGADDAVILVFVFCNDG